MKSCIEATIMAASIMLCFKFMLDFMLIYSVMRLTLKTRVWGNCAEPFLLVVIA